MLAIVFTICCTGLEVHAESEKDGISVTVSADKEQYKAEDEVKLKITVKNTNDFEVLGLKVENVLPDGVSLVSGDISKDNINLKSGEEHTMNLSVKKAETEAEQTTNTNAPSNDESISKNNINGTSNAERLPNTGESNTILIVLTITLISVIVLIACFLRDRKRFSKLLTVLICIGIVNAFGITGIIRAQSENIKSFTYEYTYKVDNVEYIHKVVVSYILSKDSNNNSTDAERKLQDGYVKDNLAQFKMEDKFDSLMDINKAVMTNTKCEFTNAEYGKDGKGTANIIIYAPDMEKIFSDGLKFATENQEVILEYNGENLQEKFQNWIDDYTIQLINSNKYESIKTEMPITIYKENNQWIVSVDSKLNDALMGNMYNFLEGQLNELYK